MRHVHRSFRRPGQRDAIAGDRVALPWTLHGTHDSHVIYGLASGKRGRILGITHQHVRDGKFVAEWTVFDELAVTHGSLLRTKMIDGAQGSVGKG